MGLNELYEARRRSYHRWFAMVIVQIVVALASVLVIGFEAGWDRTPPTWSVVGLATLVTLPVSLVRLDRAEDRWRRVQ